MYTKKKNKAMGSRSPEIANRMRRISDGRRSRGQDTEMLEIC
jgi:hypothetical protein